MNHASDPHRRYGPAPLRSIIMTWRERIRSRWKLAQMSQENPHLLNDIGLTRQQVETEIAKRFWQR
ncbi:DUF1127 domain-containing protein [Bosea sp. LjRoot237]